MSKQKCSIEKRKTLKLVKVFNRPQYLLNYANNSLLQKEKADNYNGQLILFRKKILKLL